MNAAQLLENSLQAGECFGLFISPSLVRSACRLFQDANIREQATKQLEQAAQDNFVCIR